ncbi:hypothetical protein SI65_00773 [Aspergillus cristatus]|uniref:Uncharacterized protein n=1 Tax=Aspergillus cristatus TaxID=573508 RepID=A0A1E3BQC9_ASPCR|nr:hypothetical protein SI65_00773 [Aspergillus cristatus]
MPVLNVEQKLNGIDTVHNAQEQKGSSAVPSISYRRSLIINITDALTQESLAVLVENEPGSDDGEDEDDDDLELDIDDDDDDDDEGEDEDGNDNAGTNQVV